MSTLIKDKVLRKLNLLNYQYNLEPNKIVVKLGYSLMADIVVNDDNSVEISERLNSWNFLTGIFGMRLKTSLVFNTIFTLVMSIFFLYAVITTEDKSTVFALTFVFTLSLFWILLWSIYFYIQGANIKTIISNSLDA